MATIPGGVLKTWRDGDIVDARNLNQTIETIRTAINDNFDRIKAANLPDYVDTYRKFLAVTTVVSGSDDGKTLIVNDGFKRKTMDYLLVDQSNDYWFSKNTDTLMSLNSVRFKKGTANYQNGKYTLTKSGIYNVNLFAEVALLDNVGDEVFLKVFVYSASGSVAQTYNIDCRQYQGNSKWTRVGGGINLICTKGESIGMVMNHGAANSSLVAAKYLRMTVVHVAESDF